MASKYKFMGYTITNCGYHQPDHCVWWEAVDDSGCACFHATTLRQIEFDILEFSIRREMKSRDVIAGASLADSVEEKYKREIEALREALDCVASRLRVFNRDNLNALQCRLIGRALFVAEDALGKLGGRPRKIRPSNP